MSTTTTPQAKAIPLLCATNLHQSLWLPETADHPRLRVSYGTTSNFSNTTLPVVLFIGPMFGSRWITLEFDRIARESGVRMILSDRPGMGGSTPVALNIRMRVWLETVPALLQKLDVEHVSLLTHSAGTMYTLDTLLHLPSILDPRAPYAGFIAPWVPTSESNATLMTLASKLPATFMDSLSGLQGFINSKVTPAMAFSGGLLASSSTALFNSFSSPSTANPEPQAGSYEDAAEKYEVDVDTAKAMRSLQVKYSQAEETTAANEEAKLCLQKCKGGWGAVGDYRACVRSIAQRERGGVKLTVDAGFASSDLIIGKGGQAHFEECWAQEGVSDRVDFRSRTFGGTNHDTVLIDLRHGAMKGCLERIAGSLEGRA
ncbi:hypothetical protein Q7P37_007499 [Cladosporium fusiforme]